MIDIKEENKSPVQAQPANAPACDDPYRPKPEKSPGEVWFDRLVYQGINYWVNLGMSLVIADYFRNLSGRKYLDGMTKALSGGVPNGAASKTVKQALGTLALNSGGWVLLVPMKWMEDRKRFAVHWLNNKMGVRQIAPDGHAETPDEIYIENEQPKQSWGNVLWRRTMASAATIVTGMALDKGFAKNLDKPILENGVEVHRIGGEKRATDMISGAAGKLLKTGVPGGKWLTTNPRSKAYIEFAALDSIYTVITSKIMHMTNGAKRKHMPQEIDDSCDPPAEAEAQKLAAYKKKPVAARENFAAMAKRDDTGLSLAP